MPKKILTFLLVVCLLIPIALIPSGAVTGSAESVDAAALEHTVADERLSEVSGTDKDYRRRRGARPRLHKRGAYGSLDR